VTRESSAFAAVCVLYPVLVAAVMFIVILPWIAS
jgi:hypothetical protein